MNQTWENGKKPSFGSDFDLFCPKFHTQIFFHDFYLHLILYIAASSHSMQFQGKLMNQIWENDKKPSFGLDFDPFGPNSGCQNFFLQKSGSVSH